MSGHKPVTRVFVALGELLGVADAEPFGVGVALEDAVALDVGEADALVDEDDDAVALAVGVDTTDGDDELLGVGDPGVDDTGVALAVAGVLLAVGVGSMVPVREVTELDEVSEALALPVEAEAEGALVAVGLALKVTVAVGEAEAEEVAPVVAEGVALDEAVGEAICVVEALEVGLGVVLEVTVGAVVADAVGFTDVDAHCAGMLVTEVITPPASGEAMTGTVATIENTSALTVLSAMSMVRWVRTKGETSAFIA